MGQTRRGKVVSDSDFVGQRNLTLTGIYLDISNIYIYITYYILYNIYVYYIIYNILYIMYYILLFVFSPSGAEKLRAATKAEVNSKMAFA